MLINSDFNDYYDSVARQYRDPPVYERKRIELRIDVPQRLRAPYKELPNINCPFASLKDGMRKVLLGFCGKLYWFYTDFHHHGDWAVYSHDISATKMEAAESSRYFKHGTSRQRKAIRNWLKTEGVHTHNQLLPTDAGLKEWERRWSDKDFTDVFIELDAPVFVLERTWHDQLCPSMILNPVLRKFNFVQLVDPWTATQELDMFLGGALAKQMDPTTTRTDNDVRDSKGFDKFSFRSQKRPNTK